jgi:hypothetical protein
MIIWILKAEFIFWFKDTRHRPFSMNEMTVFHWLIIKVGRIATIYREKRIYIQEVSPVWWKTLQDLTRFDKMLLITLRHINVLHEDITYIQYYMAKWSYIIKNIKTYQQFSLWTIECSLSRSIEFKILIHITLLDMITITVIDHGMSLSVLYDLTHWATQAPIFSRYM